jgi:hypothetical protein
MELTVKALTGRLELYQASVLGEVMKELEKIERRRMIDYRQSDEELAAVRRELLIGEYREYGATEAEIAELLKRASARERSSQNQLSHS